MIQKWKHSCVLSDIPPLANPEYFSNLMKSWAEHVQTGNPNILLLPAHLYKNSLKSDSQLVFT